MREDLDEILSAYAKLQRDLEAATRLMRMLDAGAMEHFRQAAEMLQRVHLQVIESFGSAQCSSLLASIGAANAHWRDAMSLFVSPGLAAEDLLNVHRTWLGGLRFPLDNVAELQAAAALSAIKVAYGLTESQRLFERIDLEALRRAAGLHQSAFLKFQDVMGQFSSTYAKLAQSIRTPQDLTYLPTYALPGATREVFVTGYALDTVCTPDNATRPADAPQAQLIADAEQDTSVCVELLRSVDPAMVALYTGAHEALHSANPDRARHVLSSLRELWTHILHRLAPDDRVLAWMPSDRKDLLNDKKQPTRRARVLYISRHIDHEPLTEFTVADTHALLKLMELFNRVHGLDPGLTDEQLRALLLRSDSWLVYILRIAEEG